MNVTREKRRLRMVLLGAAVASPFVSHMALATGVGLRLALPLAAVQAVAAGVVLWEAGPRWRLAAVLGPGLLLGALALGSALSSADGLLAAAGLSHAMLYAGLLTLFGATMLPGRTPLVTVLARRVNPFFHPGMEGYTRAVTLAWCGFFAMQIVLSAALLLLAPVAWQPFVTVLNLPLTILMAVAEYAVRRWRFRNEPHPTALAMIRGLRAAAAARASGPRAEDASQ